jgi:hypothetical protein
MGELRDQLAHAERLNFYLMPIGVVASDLRRLFDTLDGYRAAASYIAADAWDGCSDCMEILRAARTLDTEWEWAGDPNRVALELRRIRSAEQQS